MIFIGLYLTVGLICFITNNGKNRMPRKIACIVIFIYMQLLIGLRNINYGGVDTQVYARDFMRIVNQNYSFFDIFSCCRTHSATWSPIFMTGFRLVIGSWKIMEILLPRSFLCCSFVSFTMSSPSSRISPSAIFPFVPASNPITERDVTLFPLPDSPTMPSVAPRRSSTSTPSTALITPPSV